MYIIAIGWIYVALLVAVADTTVVGGVLTFLVLGLGPLALFLWLFGTPARLRRKKLREDASPSDEDPPDDPSGRPQ